MYATTTHQVCLLQRARGRQGRQAARRLRLPGRRLHRQPGAPGGVEGGPGVPRHQQLPSILVRRADAAALVMLLLAAAVSRCKRGLGGQLCKATGRQRGRHPLQRAHLTGRAADMGTRSTMPPSATSRVTRRPRGQSGQLRPAATPDCREQAAEQAAAAELGLLLSMQLAAIGLP